MRGLVPVAHRGKDHRTPYPRKRLASGMLHMKDKRGLYYYPFIDNKKVRMYVRQSDGIFWFRMWNQEDPDLWVEHGWIPYEAIQQAAAVYDKKHFDPSRAYDIDAARALFDGV